MTKSKTRDAELRKNILANEAKLEKYERVRDAISDHSLDTRRNLADINDYIQKCDNALDKLNSNAGYTSYLSTFQTKLTDDTKDLKEYRDFVKDANTSFINLYNTLETKISSLKTAIKNDKLEFNEGHTWPKDEVYLVL